MLQTSDVARTEPRTDGPRERYLRLHRWMLLARVFEEKLASLYRGGKITGGVFLGKGQEALSAALAVALRKGDIYAPLIRDSAGRFAFGESLLDAARTCLGSRLGPMRGREGNVHRGKPREGYYAMISHLGAMISTVAGGLMARRFKGVTDVVGATCIGDGGTSTGSFHEALNMAAVEKLPLVLVVANNQFAYSTPTSCQFACADIVDRAIGYGVRGHKLDGTEPQACLDVVGEAVARARGGEGPQLVVADLLRLVGHGEHDDAHYVSHALKISPIGRDCLEVARAQILGEGWMTLAQFDTLREQLQAEVESAFATALREPPPDPSLEDWCALATRTLSEGHE